MTDKVTDMEEMHLTALELCKQLYELSGWGHWPDPAYWYSRQGKINHSYMPARLEDARGYIPAYDLSYLLRKFAGKGGVTLCYGDMGCTATSHVWTAEAATPEDAVALLAIRLFAQEGVFKKEPV